MVSRSRRPLHAALVAAVSAGAVFASADAARADDALPRLEQRADVVARLESLPPNTGVALGRADVVGEMNDTARRFRLDRTGPLGRDYSVKMAWAPERRRALFAGANHGAPHRLNDVWEFDLGAMSWVLLYPPDLPRSYAGLGEDASDVEYRDGVLVTKRGGPAVIGHTWWGLTYDPGVRRLLWMNVWNPKFERLIEQRDGDPAKRYRGLPLWSFDPQTGRWELLRANAPGPRVGFAGMLEYVDSLGGPVWHGNNWQMRGTWLYDARRNAWEDLGANAAAGNFAKNAPPPEQVGYYDPGRDLLVVQRGRDTFHFDVKARIWSRVRREPKGATNVPVGHDARTPMYFDPSSGHGLLVDFRANAIWAYEPDRSEWRRLAPRGDPMPTGSRRLAYFDPARRVLVVIDGLDVWAYRYGARN